mmetsp:Transcript_34696/g.79136  ORF Transcript_34696/g.79136 Transcript_34696/m.79136 type:complete len:326 (+) Transcript_34696:22-999(+)
MDEDELRPTKNMVRSIPNFGNSNRMNDRLRAVSIECPVDSLPKLPSKIHWKDEIYLWFACKDTCQCDCYILARYCCRNISIPSWEKIFLVLWILFLSWSGLFCLIVDSTWARAQKSHIDDWYTSGYIVQNVTSEEAFVTITFSHQLDFKRSEWFRHSSFSPETVERSCQQDWEKLLYARGRVWHDFTGKKLEFVDPAVSYEVHLHGIFLALALTAAGWLSPILPLLLIHRIFVFGRVAPEPKCNECKNPFQCQTEHPEYFEALRRRMWSGKFCCSRNPKATFLLVSLLEAAGFAYVSVLWMLNWTQCLPLTPFPLPGGANTTTTP